MLQCIIDPLTAGRGNPVIALTAPCVGSWIFWIGRPEEANAFTPREAMDNVLAHECHRLGTVRAALDSFHAISKDHGPYDLIRQPNGRSVHDRLDTKKPALIAPAF
jgi:hypothetical protein